MKTNCLFVFVSLCVILIMTSGGVFAGGRVENIARHWKPEGRRPLAIARVAASSDAGAQYVASHAVDGDRGSRWVARVAPSEAAPQWITLDLLIPQEVTAVAFFGGTPGNDGLQDGQVQVAGSNGDQFSAVATIREAKSAGWLATFDPVKTSAVRVLVKRSPSLYLTR